MLVTSVSILMWVGRQQELILAASIVPLEA